MSAADLPRRLLWAYPWDILDQGPDALERVRAAGIDGLSVAAAYHSARLLLPSNPRRAVLTLDPGAAYFHPDPSAYPPRGPRPRVAGEYAAADPLAAICALAADAGLPVLAWTVFLHNSRIGAEQPDLTLENVFGDRYQHALCPSHPAARAYAVALGADIARRYPVAALDVEALAFLGYRHAAHHDKAAIALGPLHQALLSICFCRHCRARYERAGLDPAQAADALQRELRAGFAGDRRLAGLDAHAGLCALIGPAGAAQLLAARADAVASLWAELRRAVPPRVTLLVRAAGSPFADTGKTPLPPDGLPAAGGLVCSFLATARSQLPAEIGEAPWAAAGGRPVWAGLSVAEGRPECRDAADLAERVGLLRAAGADRFAFYAYGLMPPAGLDWVAAALSAG